VQPVRVVYPGICDKPSHADLYYGTDVLAGLRLLPDQSVHMVATSPPYWGLRDYGLPSSVWGGDATCTHSWKKQKSYKDSPTRTGAEGVGFDDADKTRAQRWTEHATCKKCGAWQGCLGLEPTPELFVSHLVEVFHEIRRVLRDDGTLWLNLGDSYASTNAGNRNGVTGTLNSSEKRDSTHRGKAGNQHRPLPTGLKTKDLVGIPWMTAFALRTAGWYLRSDILWAKANCMPEAVTDRPTKSHEYVFLLTKSPQYFYDQDAIREPHVDDWYDRANTWREGNAKQQQQDEASYHPYKEAKPFSNPPNVLGRNKRTVWNVNPKPYKGAHFAVWPEELVKPMILAGTSEKGCCPTCGAPWERVVERQTYRDLTGERPMNKTQCNVVRAGWRNGGPKTATLGWQPACNCNAVDPLPCVVLDPFSGSGTTGKVSLSLGRNYIGIDLSEKYLELAQIRIAGQTSAGEAGEDLSLEDLFEF
jgi:DNA modification methylase